jgi:hypothetical protein
MDYRDLMLAVVSNSNTGFGAEAGGLLDNGKRPELIKIVKHPSPICIL